MQKMVDDYYFPKLVYYASMRCLLGFESNIVMHNAVIVDDYYLFCKFL